MKISRLSVFAIVFSSLLVVACASKPKTVDVVIPSVNESEDSEKSENSDESENQSETAGESEVQENQIEENSETAESVLEEKLDESDLPVIPPLPEEKTEPVYETPDYSEQTEPAEPEVPVIADPEESENEEKKSELEEKIAPVEEVKKELEEITNPDETYEQGKTEISSENQAGSNNNSSENVETIQNNGTETTDNNSAAGVSDNAENKSAAVTENQESEKSAGESSVLEADEKAGEDEFNAQLEEAKKIVPSRSVTMLRNQYLDIVYPGTGWIYLGQTDSQKDFIFYGRKLGGKDTGFTLRSKNPGKFILHFYKNDVLTGEYIDDYLEVEVLDKTGSTNEHIKAASYAQVVPPKAEITAETVNNGKNSRTEQVSSSKQDSDKSNKTEKISELKKNDYENHLSDEDSKGMTVIQSAETADKPVKPVTSLNGSSTSDKMSSVSNGKTEIPTGSASGTKNVSTDGSSEELIARAEKLFNDKDYVNSKKVLDKFFEKASTDLDRGLYLQGQLLETKSAVQNIKGAIDSYDLLVKNYPGSKYWTQANKRSIYLKRFYINIK